MRIAKKQKRVLRVMYGFRQYRELMVEFNRYITLLSTDPEFRQETQTECQRAIEWVDEFLDGTVAIRMEAIGEISEWLDEALYALGEVKKISQAEIPQLDLSQFTIPWVKL